MKLSIGVVAYKVLKVANISNEKQELKTQIAYVKSESVFYLSKATDGRYQDLKDNSRYDICQYPKDVIELTEISIQGRAIDTIGTCHMEFTTMNQKKTLTNGVKKHYTRRCNT